MASWRRDFSSRAEKYFTRFLRSLVKYFSTREEKFRIPKRLCSLCNVLFIIYISMKYQRKYNCRKEDKFTVFSSFK